MTRRRSAGAPLLSVFVAALVFAGLLAPAHAEPTPAEKKAAAQALFDEARKLTGDGKFTEACPKYIESERLDSTMGTKFYLADCLEHIGRLASAWTYYIEVTDAARAAGLKDREGFARERAAALQPRIGKITVVVSASARAVAGLEVKRDGLALGEALWGTAVPVDPGAHVVSAQAAGKAAWEARIELTEPGQSLTIEIPRLEELAKAEPPPPKPVETPMPLPPPVELPPRGLSGQQIAGIAVGAAGVVGVGLGAIFGGVAAGKQADSNAQGHCDAQDFCDSQGLALRKEAISAATVSTAFIIAGGVALAGGVVLLVTAPRAAPQPAPVVNGLHRWPRAAAALVRVESLPALQLAAGPGMLTLTGSW